MNARFLLLALLLASASSGATIHAATGPAVAGFESYDRQFPELLERWSVPGVVVAVAQDGRIVFARGYGLADRDTGRPMQPDTRARVGSVSKTITAAVVLKLVDDGRLTLDTHIFPLLGWPTPVYSGAARDPRLDQITVAQALSHTAGWRTHLAPIPFSGGTLGFDPLYSQLQIAQFLGQTPPATAETIARAMVGQPLQAAPGTVYDYSNLGFVVLARVIEHVTGLPYEQAVRENLATAGIDSLQIGATRRAELRDDEPVYYDFPGAAPMPSQLGDAGLVAEPYGYSLQTWDGCGGWTVSALDGVRFLLALDGAGASVRLLSPSLRLAMRTEQFPGSAYGYGWCTSNQPLSSDGGHNGGLAGSCALAVRSADGRRHTFVVFNSRPANVDAFLTETFQTLHSLTDLNAAALPDFSLSTLGWDAWGRRHFGGAAVNETDDSDHDGIPNLVEYGAGLDPARADAVSPVTITSRPDGRQAVTFRRLILAHALAWQLEVSSDGRTWSTPAATVDATVLNSDGTLNVTVTVPGEVRIRLRVTRLSGGASATWSTPSSGWESWLQSHFGATGSDALADPDGDGAANLAEFAAGLDPTRQDAQPVASVSLRPDRTPVLTYRRIAVASGLTWMVDTSADGIAWQTLTADSAPTRTNPDGTLAVEVEVPGAAHVRLRIRLGSCETVIEPEMPAPATSSGLVNIAARAFAGSGNNVAIGGFVITGSAPKQVLIRAVGPTLATQGIPAAEVLHDPIVELHQARADNPLVARNDNWTDSPDAAEIRTASAAVGAAPLAAGDSTSAALLLTLRPGGYTFLVRGADDAATGVVLAEVYDADAENGNALFVNIATRAYCATGNGVAIGGFVVTGQGAKRLLLRAVGPTLTTQGLSQGEALQNPFIEVHDARRGNAIIASNDDWTDNADTHAIVATAARIGATPFAASDRKSSALLLELPPGVYSFVVRGQGGSSGIVLAEVYDAD